MRPNIKLAYKGREITLVHGITSRGYAWTAKVDGAVLLRKGNRLCFSSSAWAIPHVKWAIDFPEGYELAEASR
jgi:hypothetical protein